MKTYEVSQHIKPNGATVRVTALTPAGAVENLLIQGRWFTLTGVTELIDVQEISDEPVVLALSPTGQVTRTI